MPCGQLALVQLAAVFPRREVEPAPAGPEETALVGEAKQVGGLGERELEPAKILFGKLTACVIQQLDEGGRFFFQASLEGSLAHAQFAGNLFPPWLAVRQAPYDYLACSVASLRMVKMPKVFAGVALVHLRKYRVRGGQRREQVGACKQQAGGGCIERYRTTKGASVGRKINRSRVWQFDHQWMHIAPADPAAEADDRDENELDALPRHRPRAAKENEGHAESDGSSLIVIVNASLRMSR